MEKIGILIELKDGNIKKTNFGVITLARRQGCELFALILNGDAAACKEQLQQYGIGKIIDLTS
nr:hypothetical protein [Phycisphaerae bacterium]NIP53615.1 hypothetical protein [Phycisphaerae bacterium]NIS50372.1 hypothetical protein [Phycisphaerae bacterium]NIX32812.1 hypothetical protein [Phycisphaerae bacterium]